jgi:hypothetical protein
MKLIAALAAFSLTAALAQAPLPGPMVGAIGAPAPFVPVSNAGTDVICALHADTITGLTCGNAVTDGTTETAFATSVTIPAGAITSSSNFAFSAVFGSFTTATIPSITLRVRLGGIGGAILFSSNNVLQAGTSGGLVLCTVSSTTAASASAPLVAACVGNNPLGGNSMRNSVLTNTALTVSGNTSIAQVLVFTVQYSAATAGNAVWQYNLAPR